MPRQPPPTYGESSRRLLQLKPAIDRIIADCKSDAGELHSGLEILKNYQLDIIEELDRSENALRFRDQSESYTPEYGYDPTNDIKRENAKLLNNLKAEISHSNNLAGNVDKLEHQVRRLRREFDEREEDDHSHYENYPPSRPPIYNRWNAPYDDGYYGYDDQGYTPSLRNSYHNPRGRDRGAQYYDSGSDFQSKDELIRSLMAENHKLKAIIRELEARLQDTEIRLRRAEDTHGLGYLREQLQNLKRENEELRRNTIKLLSQKSHPSSGASLDDHWRREFQRLKQQIEGQNQLKSEFLQELSKFKTKYKRCVQQKRLLQQELNSVRQGQKYNRAVNDYRVEDGYKRGEYEQRGDIDKYKTALEDMRNKY